MEESELDEWFNESKERLEERFYAEAEKDVYAAKARFDKDYQKLIKEFQERHERLYDQQLRAARLRKPIERAKMTYELKVAAVKQWFFDRRLAIKKWFFDRRIKRMLKDKSDL